jgi:hypothetical protein
MSPNRSTAFVLALGLLATGCSTDNGPSGPSPTGVARSVTSVLERAPQLLSLAVSGKRVRGEQDEMLRVEAKLPGFGGFYIDSLGNVVIYQKHVPAAAAAALARKVLFTEYAGRSERNVREIMSNASNAQIREGAYSLSELIAVENSIDASPASLPGLVGVGTSIFHNRVIAGFRDTASMVAALASLPRKGIPKDAVVGEVWGQPHQRSYWYSIVRPTRGGIELSVMNRTRFPWDYDAAGHLHAYFGNGSLGFNVRAPGGVDYMMLAAHSVNTYSGTNGAVNDTVVQSGLQSTTPYLPQPIGVITVNPPWTEGAQCPVRDSVSGAHFDYCTTADVALGTYVGALSDREIGTSDYEGQHGDVGCCNSHIHGWYPIAGVLSPEFVKQQQTLGVHKSGSKTGTTTGTIGMPRMNVYMQICWKLVRDAVPPVVPCATQPWMQYQAVTQVLYMGNGGGDSGAPVFSGNGLPMNALGILVAGFGHDNDQEICDAGNACTVFFARWDEIQLRLGLTLNPATTQ